MHPQTLWLASIYESTESERRRALIHRDDVSDGEKVRSVRGGLWALLLRRRTEPSLDVVVMADAPPSPTPAPSAQLGCA